MRQTESDSQALVEALLEEAQETSQGEHLELDELVDFHTGVLDPSRQRQLLDHLVGCRPCTARLLEMEPLIRPEPPARDGVAALARAASWRELLDRIARGAATGASRFLFPVAASLLVALLALSVWVAVLSRNNQELRQQIAMGGQALPNIPLFQPQAQTRSSGGDSDVVELLPGVPSFVLIFTPATRLPHYEVRFLLASGGELQSHPGLRLNPDGVLTLGLPRNSLPQGDVRLHLLGGEGDRLELLDEYRIRLIHR